MIMKYNYIYTVFVLIVKLLCWRQRCIEYIHYWIRAIIDWDGRDAFECQEDHEDDDMQAASETMYVFRPYEVKRINYKSYGTGLKGRGINMYPKPRSGHRIVVNDTDIFCFGGFNPDITTTSERTRTSYLFQEMWKFNTMTTKWSKTFEPNMDPSRMPEELASNAVVMKDDMLVVFGGTGYPFGRACSNKCYLFWPYGSPRQVCQIETTGDKPEPQYGQAIMLRDRYLYVIGGTTGFEYSSDIYRLDLVTKIWESVYICNPSNSDDPKGRYRHEIAYDDQYIYMFGGGTSEVAYDLENIPAFDIKQSKWLTINTRPDPNAPLPGVPEARKCHSCIQYDTPNGIDVIIAGGYYEDQRFFNDIWKLNLRTHQWQLYQTAKMPQPLYFHDAATNGNGLMYIFGGIAVNRDATTSARTNDIYKMWTAIPKLSEICWDALIHYHPHLPLLNRGQLLEAGIPPKFAERAVRGQSHLIDF